MPLQHWGHSHYWQDHGEAPPPPGRRRLTLLGAGHGALLGLLVSLAFFFRG